MKIKIIRSRPMKGQMPIPKQFIGRTYEATYLDDIGKYQIEEPEAPFGGRIHLSRSEIEIEIPMARE